jgi:hypothetical protein
MASPFLEIETVLQGIAVISPKGSSQGTFQRYFITVVKGKMAIFRALFMAVVISL